jgi:hypothetical protein
VICSVLGLLLGVGFKIWQYRRDEKKKEKHDNEASEAQVIPVHKVEIDKKEWEI